MAKYSSIRSGQLEQLVALRDQLLSEKVPERQKPAPPAKEARHNPRPKHKPRPQSRPPSAGPRNHPSQKPNHKPTPTPTSAALSPADERLELKAGRTKSLGIIQLVPASPAPPAEPGRTGMCWARPVAKSLRKFFSSWRLCRISNPAGRWWILEVQIVFKAQLSGNQATQVHWRALSRSHPEAADAFSEKWMSTPLEISVSATRLKESNGATSASKQSPPTHPKKQHAAPAQAHVRAREVHANVEVVSHSEGGNALVPSGDQAKADANGAPTSAGDV